MPSGFSPLTSCRGELLARVVGRHEVTIEEDTSCPVPLEEFQLAISDLQLLLDLTPEISVVRTSTTPSAPKSRLSIHAWGGRKFNFHLIEVLSSIEPRSRSGHIQPTTRL